MKESSEKCSKTLLARIYAEEKDYPMLYQVILAERHQVLQMLELYMALLPEEYHEELLQKSLKNIEKGAHRAEKRSEYARVVSQIRRFATLPGAKPLAEVLVANLRSTYMRRRAYIDELNKRHP